LPKTKSIFIHPPRLTRQFIYQKAEEFRRKYVDPIDRVPVPIIDIVEIKLCIEPLPIRGLMDIDIDGFLTSDLKKICVDSDIYQNLRNETRLRFTCAHEIGHWVLHREEIKLCAFRNPDEWIQLKN